MSEITSAAIHAAQNHRIWGRWAAVRYCEKRGVPRHLLTLAMQLEACQNFKE